MPEADTSAIAPDALHALLMGNGELALLDVREARAFHAGHLNLARQHLNLTLQFAHVLLQLSNLQLIC